MAYARRRDANEADIVQALRVAGCFVWHLHQPVDLLVWTRRQKRFVAIEVKNKRGKNQLTPTQVEMLELHESEGVAVYVARTVDEALEIVGA